MATSPAAKRPAKGRKAKTKNASGPAQGPIGNTGGLYVPVPKPNAAGGSTKIPIVPETEEEKGFLEKKQEQLQGQIDDWVAAQGNSKMAMGAGALATALNAVFFPTSVFELVPVGKVFKLAKKGKQAAEEAKKTKKVEDKAKDAKGAGDTSGGRVDGDGGPCKLRRYKEGCPDGRTPHHVVGDHAFKQPGDGAYYPAGPKYPNGFKHADGWAVCASGKTKSSAPGGARVKRGAFATIKKWFSALDEHGKIHALLDPAEIALGAKGNPPGTTSLVELEAVGVAAASKVLNCNPAEMLADLRSKHQTDGLPADMKVRADPFGSVKGLDPKSMGTGSMGRGMGGN